MLDTTNARSGPYVASGSGTEYPFHFPVLSPLHLAVYKDGERQDVNQYGTTLTTNGGSVRFHTPPAAGSLVAIVRDVPIIQDVDLQNNTAFLPEVIEMAMDRLTMICQQMQEILSRTLTAPPTEDLDQAQLFEQFMGIPYESAMASSAAAAAASSSAAAAISEQNAATSAAAAANVSGITEHNADENAHASLRPKVFYSPWYPPSYTDTLDAFEVQLTEDQVHLMKSFVQIRCIAEEANYPAGTITDLVYTVYYSSTSGLPTEAGAYLVPVKAFNTYAPGSGSFSVYVGCSLGESIHTTGTFSTPLYTLNRVTKLIQALDKSNWEMRTVTTYFS